MNVLNISVSISATITNINVKNAVYTQVNGE